MGLRGRTMPLLMELGNWFHRILQRCRPDGAGPPLWRGGAYHRALGGPRYCPSPNISSERGEADLWGKAEVDWL